VTTKAGYITDHSITHILFLLLKTHSLTYLMESLDYTRVTRMSNRCGA